MTDAEAFELGKNIATTPGKVVFQNELMQLIQYAPTTKQVAPAAAADHPAVDQQVLHPRPPAQEQFIKYCVDQGHTVFVISWVNPDARHRDKGLDDYMREGRWRRSMRSSRRPASAEVNVIGYCIGGTLLATVLATWRPRATIASAVGHLLHLASWTSRRPASSPCSSTRSSWPCSSAQMDEKGYLDAGSMATTFNLMRANDLIWSFVVSNYLLGKEPLPFDLLYWNSDSTRMPAAMHRLLPAQHVPEEPAEGAGRHRARRACRSTCARSDTPVYLLSAREDHIAPWRNTYAAARLLCAARCASCWRAPGTSPA